ncbi:MAG TPA: cytochrome c3 family protein [Vicinamibacteria bacterium]|nr:cytochrome c3 family protein [Vicinamibacteria bacterium]
MRHARRLTAVVLLLPPLAVSAGTLRSTKHGDPQTGAARTASAPIGSCGQCHQPHGDPSGQRYPFSLFTADDNALCGSCHNLVGPLGSFQGMGPWDASAHARSPHAVWPGPPARPSQDAGKCVNCHDPHGRADRDGLIPSLARARDAQLCLACHDGSPALKDVERQAKKAYAHPLLGTRTGRHQADEGGNPARFGRGSRHAACVDCHNPHRGQTHDQVRAQAPDAPDNMTGISRIRVSNGAPGTAPVYRYAGPEDTSFAAEYEICFKCHSSWTTRPAGQPDLALLFSTSNPSFHPVEAAGRNPRIDTNAFVNGWNASRLVYCSDCHGSDDVTVAGPHGSSYRYILKGPYATTAAPSRVGPTDVCFSCHSWDTYANPAATTNALAASRWNPGKEPAGHAFHVGTKGYSCWACHESHGSTLNPGLVATTGRLPGMASYLQAPKGGQCTATCHTTRPGPHTYSINYGR